LFVPGIVYRLLCERLQRGGDISTHESPIYVHGKRVRFLPRTRPVIGVQRAYQIKSSSKATEERRAHKKEIRTHLTYPVRRSKIELTLLLTAKVLNFTILVINFTTGACLRALPEM